MTNKLPYAMIIIMIIVFIKVLSSAEAETDGQGVEHAKIWFVPEDPVYRFRRGFPRANYEDLFDKRDSWTTSRTNTDVFGIGPQMIELGPDKLLKKVIDFVSAEHVPLDVEMHMNTFGHDDCGHMPYIESYAAPGKVKADMERLRKLGANVKYVTMDEPLWFGHEFNGRRNACHDSLQEIADRVGESVRDVKAVFPDAEIGEVEPFNGGRANWPETIFKWLESFKKVTGSYPAYFHADIIWNNSEALQQFSSVARQLQRMQIPVGIIYDGDALDKSAIEFNRKAIERSQSFEKTLLHCPDAVIMSWMLEPGRMVPESDPGTMTGLLKSYVEGRNKIACGQ